MYQWSLYWPINCPHFTSTKPGPPRELVQNSFTPLSSPYWLAVVLSTMEQRKLLGISINVQAGLVPLCLLFWACIEPNSLSITFQCLFFCIDKDYSTLDILLKSILSWHMLCNFLDAFHVWCSYIPLQLKTPCFKGFPFAWILHQVGSYFGVINMNYIFLLLRFSLCLLSIATVPS